MLEIINADVLEALKQMESQSVHTCVTSPPYWGLRDYGVDGQLGLEPTPEQYVQNMVELFREVRRTLRDDGTLWLNLGDSYVGTGHKGEWKDPKYANGRNGQSKAINNKVEGMKSKDLVGIPWMVAFALRADGWYLRSDIIWNKPNAMPESVKDRPTKAHEYLFLLTKSEKYYYDHEAIKEESVYNGKPKPGKQAQTAYTGLPVHTGNLGVGGVDGKRNKRSVWTIATKPFKGAHFAVFPPDLVEPCILAGCPENGVVLDPFCGSGTTLEVAAKHGRNAIGIELNPAYVEIAKARLEASTTNVNVR